MKKGGAGGSYTWGTPMDVQDYESVGVTGAGVTVAAAPVTMAPIVSAAPMSVSIQDTSAFPTLGGSPVVSRGVTTWGPQKVTLSEDSLRVGAVDMVGAQHPRNMFAKKPYVRPATTIATAPTSSGLIDWSQAGIPDAVVKQILSSNANTGAAHLGPYGTAAPVVPLETLRTTNAGYVSQQQMYAPKITKFAAPSSSKPVVIQQPVKR